MKEESREPGELRYHYNREERTAGLPDYLRNRSRKKGIFRGNRSLVITLIDVVFLVILFVVISVVTRLMGDNTVIPGYTVSASATVFGDRVLVSAKVTAREDSEQSKSVRVRIGYTEGGYRIELDDFLPAAQGVEEIYRGSLIRDSSQKQVKIEFYTDDASGSMTARIKAE